MNFSIFDISRVDVQIFVIILNVDRFLKVGIHRFEKCLFRCSKTHEKLTPIFLDLEIICTQLYIKLYTSIER